MHNLLALYSTAAEGGGGGSATRSLSGDVSGVWSHSTDTQHFAELHWIILVQHTKRGPYYASVKTILSFCYFTVKLRYR